MRSNVTPFISICIPAYKRVHYLDRLLKSISIQTYSHYEIVITDDSPSDEVKELLENFSALPIQYFKNSSVLGTPENWNEGARRAKGEWIKIMHDDDWFSCTDSLQQFATHIVKNPGTPFFFSAYRNIYEQDNNRQEDVHVSGYIEKQLQKNMLCLFRSNYIGNPSCILYKKNDVWFDKEFKWVVDFEFYMRYLRAVGNKFVYIDNVLINVGMNASQVTTYTFRISKVEVPENHGMLAKMGFSNLKDIFVYDYFWRLYRNLKIRKREQLIEDGYKGKISPVLLSMIAWQSKLPFSLLRIGVFSKMFMFLHYITHYFNINDKAVDNHS